MEKKANITRIIPSRYQTRTHYDPERLYRLARSIKANGLIHPPIVFAVPVKPGEKPLDELVAGHRRFFALLALAWTESPIGEKIGLKRACEKVAQYGRGALDLGVMESLRKNADWNMDNAYSLLDRSVISVRVEDIDPKDPADLASIPFDDIKKQEAPHNWPEQFSPAPWIKKEE